MMCSTSCSEQDTKKYCCSRRSRLPASGSSFGIEHLGDGLRDDLVLDRLVVVAGVEGLQVERLDGPRAPQRQHVAGVHAVALDRRVVGDALEHPSAAPSGRGRGRRRRCSARCGRPSLTQVAHVGLGDLPRVAVAQPVVGLLDLPAVVDLLVEDAELVADAVADRRALERGQRVEVAGGEPAEAAVAEPRLLLAGQHSSRSWPSAASAARGRVLDAEVEQVVAELRAHQELGRQVAGHLAAEVERGLRGGHPAVLHAVADGQRKCPVVVLWLQGGRRPADRVAQVVDDAAPQRVGGQPGAAGLVGDGRGCVRVLDDVGHRRQCDRRGRPQSELQARMM